MIEKLNYPHLGILIMSWFVADLGLPLIVRLGRRFGALDRPGGHKAHAAPVPALGGYGILIAIAVALLSVLRFTSFEDVRPLFGIVLGSVAFLVLGGLDDLRPIPAAAKLGFLLAGTAVLWAFGIRTHLFPPGWEWLDLAFTVIWIAGVTSAMNSLDNWDGVAGGVTAIAAAALFWIAWRNYSLIDDPGWRQTQKLVSYFSAALLGSCLGFLRYNFHPAGLFLGNNGSFLLGFLLAALAMLGGWSQADPLRSFLVPCCILAVPLFDLTFVTLVRWRTGVVGSLREAVAYCGRDHTAHRIAALGLGTRATSLCLWGCGVVAAIAGAWVADPRVSRAACLGIAAVSLAGLAAAAAVLRRAPLPAPVLDQPSPGKEP